MAKAYPLARVFHSPAASRTAMLIGRLAAGQPRLVSKTCDVNGPRLIPAVCIVATAKKKTHSANSTINEGLHNPFNAKRCHKCRDLGLLFMSCGTEPSTGLHLCEFLWHSG